MPVFANEKFNSSLIFNIIITTLIIMGVFLGFSPCIPSTNYFIYVLIAISPVVALVSGILLTNVRYGKLIFVILAAAAFILLNPFALARGAAGIADRLIQLWNLKYEDAIPLYGIAHSSGDIQRLVIFFDILICPFIWYIVKGNYVLRTGILMLAVSIAAHVLGSNMAMMSVFVFFICWICIWFRRVMGAYIFQAFIWTAVSVAIIAVMCVICPYNKIGTIDNFHDTLSETVDNIRYGSDSLPKGKMEKAYSMLDNSEKRLEVHSNHAKILYLRGFVGERF